MNGEGQLLSDVQILMLTGQIALHCNLSDSQQRHAVKEREWQEGFCRKKELRNAVVLNAVSAFDPLNVVLNGPHLLSSPPLVMASSPFSCAC